jgi:UV DNA damage repair endonuclease
MILGSTTPKLSYIGPHKEDSKSPSQIDSFVDLLTLIDNNLSLNSQIDILNTCIDTSSLSFTSNFYNETIDEESERGSELINKINLHVARTGSKIFFYLGKDYFLGTQIESVERTTVTLITKLSEILETVGVNYPSILIRIGSAYGNRKATMKNFCERTKKLGKSSSSRLCVMNDDKPSLFSVTDLLSGVYYETGIPICFRILPHQFNDGGLSIREALFLSCSTWKSEHKPVFIHSEAKAVDEFGFPIDSKPSDYLFHRIPTFGLGVDIIIDSPAKEDSCLKYRMEHKSLPPIVINKRG